MGYVVLIIVIVVGIYGICKGIIDTSIEYGSHNTGKTNKELEFLREVSDIPRGEVYYDRLRELKEKREQVSKEVAAECTSDVVLCSHTEVENTDEAEEMKNIAKNKKDTTWFIDDKYPVPEPSEAEKAIIAELNKYNIRWKREVSFRGLQFNAWSYPRFDFYLYNNNIIIEYDGKLYHNTGKTRATDKAKEKFCKDNGIRVIRYNAKHYYQLGMHIQLLIKSLKVNSKM